MTDKIIMTSFILFSTFLENFDIPSMRLICICIVGTSKDEHTFFSRFKKVNKQLEVNVSQIQPGCFYQGEFSVEYILVVYDPAGPHEALSGPLELQQRQTRVSHWTAVSRVFEGPNW